MVQRLHPTTENLGWCQPQCLSLPWESLTGRDRNGCPHPAWLLNGDPKSIFGPDEPGKPTVKQQSDAFLNLWRA